MDSQNAVTSVSTWELTRGLTLILRCLERYANDLTADPHTNPEVILQLIRGMQDDVRSLEGELDRHKGDLVDIEPCAPAKERAARRKEILRHHRDPMLSAQAPKARRGGGRTEEIVLVLTADCNLRCRYCYQNAKEPRTLPWPVLQAGLDLLLGLPRAEVALSFSGGEPTLEFGSIRRAVEYVDGRRRAPGTAGRTVTYHLTTNGLLLGPSELAFLAEHDVMVDLSTDGVAPPQDLRRAGSVGAVEELLDRWRRDHASHFARRGRIAMTLTRPGIPHLADSFEHFFSKRVPDIVLQAAMVDASWVDEDLAELERQLTRVRALAVAHLRSTGEVAFSGFRGSASRTRASYARTWGCAAPLGRALTVDVDGTVYACALAARSYQRFEDPGIERRLSRLALGDVRDPGFGGRLAALPVAAADSGIFGPKRIQHAGRRFCATCRHRAACFVCPIVRARQAPVGDIDAVPERLCAFNRALARHGRAFRRQQRAVGLDRLPTWLFGRGPATT